MNDLKTLFNMQRWLPPVLLIVFVLYWLYNGLVARDMVVWLGEAVLTLAFIVFLWRMYQGNKLSVPSYILIFLFLVLTHAGIRYSFLDVPYDNWSQALLGLRINETFGFDRNHFDRFVHFTFGLLFYFPIFEMVKRVAGIDKPFWRHFFTFVIINACSAIYEIIELAGVFVLDTDSYLLYLSTQGDMLDAPKDMVMALLGAVTGMALVAAGERRRQGRHPNPILLPAALLLLMPGSLPAPPAPNPAANATLIIERSLERYKAITFHAEVTMLVQRPGWESEVKFKLWTAGDDYGMVVITAPARDRGQSFLKRHDDLWHWIPSVEKTVRMSGALLSQSWMGSDFSLDDMIRNRSLADHYVARYLQRDTIGGIACHQIELLPNDGAPVVWGRVVTWISEQHNDQVKAGFYDERGNLVQVMEAKEFKNYGGRRMPSQIRMTPMAREGHQTTLQFVTYDFNMSLEEDFFSLQQLRQIRE